jgi:hypothetical protein
LPSCSLVKRLPARKIRDFDPAIPQFFHHRSPGRGVAVLKTGNGQDIHLGRAMGFGGVTHADLQDVTAMAAVMNLGAENNFHGSGWRSFLQ